MGDMEDRLSWGEVPRHRKLQSSRSGSVWLLSAWVRRGLTTPMGVPKMWVEGRLKVEPARENT